MPSTGIIPATGALLNSNYVIIPSDLTEGIIHSWNAAFQRQLPWNFTAEVAYVGNRGVDLVLDIDRNAGMVLGANNAGRPQFAAFGRTGASTERTNEGKRQYHSMQVKVDRRYKNGILVTNSYTLGRARDYTSENTGISVPIDRERSWGLADFNRKHSYTLSALYELPWGPGKKWLNEGVTASVLGGWQLSGLFLAYSGVPLNITAAGTLNTPGNTLYANLNGEQQVLGGLGPGQKYLDTSVYAVPPTATLGSMTRNAGPEGPGFWELDMSLFKRFKLSSRMTAEFRVDAFNVTNSVRWGNPNTTVGNVQFGIINPTNDSQRRLRFGGRVTF